MLWPHILRPPVNCPFAPNPPPLLQLNFDLVTIGELRRFVANSGGRGVDSTPGTTARVERGATHVVSTASINRGSPLQTLYLGCSACADNRTPTVLSGARDRTLELSTRVVDSRTWLTAQFSSGSLTTSRTSGVFSRSRRAAPLTSRTCQVSDRAQSARRPGSLPHRRSHVAVFARSSRRPT